MDESEVVENLLPPPPERVGPYRLEDGLGAGGMGAVYRAYDERLERPVAIKHILPELAGDEKAWKRLRREARTVARMNHPAVVQIYDIEEHDSGDWIVMELVDGQTLFSMLKDGPLELPEALELVCQITAGLAAAHAQGIVHRDLKTENVMVTRDGKIKILDFGLAKALWRGADTSLSIEGSILGTGRSMSPEQALGDEVTHLSDLFSLGTLIYEIVTGKSPFSGSSIFRILASVCSDPHPPPREVNPAVPEALAALIDRLLEKDPPRRPQSADEVLQALEAISAPSSPREGSDTSKQTLTDAATAIGTTSLDVLLLKEYKTSLRHFLAKRLQAKRNLALQPISQPSSESARNKSSVRQEEARLLRAILRRIQKTQENHQETSRM